VGELGMGEQAALRLEADDPVPSRRSAFVVPPWPGGAHPDWAYFAGNSLGLMPRAAAAALDAELESWGQLAVEGWFEGDMRWLEVASAARPSIARLVGAGEEEEVAAMNTLTVNLHLLMASFYRPQGERRLILIEDAAFPSDSHAVQSQAALHGHDPSETVVRIRPRQGEATLRTEDVVEAIERERGRLALVLLGAVNYLTGELLDVAAITAATRAAGAVSGWDLAHAIGNVPLAMHDDGADFAVWCHYKYVNAGPGAPGGAFVHRRHATGEPPLRMAGWWGVDRAERFRMEPDFVPAEGAEGWAVSTPPILSFAPLRASLALFDEVGLPALRQRSIRLTAYLESLLDEVANRRRLRLTTPRDPRRRGCQLSLATNGARALAARLRHEHGVVCDFREPDVLRFAPAPLYSTYHDCWRAASALDAVLEPL
jgi:kynureninase